MRVVIQTIDHAKQSYNTCGDWQFENDTLYVSVSSMNDWRYEMLVGIHECIEALLCYKAGINGAEVDAFDKEFEAAREGGCDGSFVFRDRLIIDPESEPGDHKDAPYYTQHQVATGVERILAALLTVDWLDYDRTCASLSPGR